MEPVEFKPLWPLKGGWEQTIISYAIPELLSPLGERFHRITVEKDVTLSLVEYPEISDEAPKAAVIMIHGLGGSHRSNYIRRFVRHFRKEGIRSYAMNMRNCGAGLGMSHKVYNAGDSEDLRQVIAYVRKRHPDLSIVVCGFSLGGNILLKTLGEAKKAFPRLGAIVISPACDLEASSAKLSRSAKGFFDRYFLRDTHSQYLKMEVYLSRKAEYRREDLRSLRDFDDQITAPLSGFSGVEEYYDKAASVHHLGKIKNQTLVISSHDDPVTTVECFLDHKSNPHLELMLTRKGGHVAFLSPEAPGLRWADHRAFEWISRFIS